MIKTKHAADREGLVKDEFFPHGRNYKGRIVEMDAQLGNSKGGRIERTMNAGEYYDTSATLKCRLYLLTKKKVTISKKKSLFILQLKGLIQLTAQNMHVLFLNMIISS